MDPIFAFLRWPEEAIRRHWLALGRNPCDTLDRPSQAVGTCLLGSGSPNMSSLTLTANSIVNSGSWRRPKYLVFTLLGLMLAYVLQHNERFVVDPKDPSWERYEPFKWWLLAHGLGGAAAMLLAPMQLSDRLRRRYAQAHRVAGRIYVAGAVVAGLTGIYIQYVQEQSGLPRSFTMAATAHGTLWMLTTTIALALILNGKAQHHRQWMIRSFMVGPVVFLAVRVITGVTGWDRLEPSIAEAISETVVWMCVACSIPLADLVLQCEELMRSRKSTPKA